MASSILLGAVMLCTAFVAAQEHLNPLSDEFIALINSEQNSWTAGRNFPADSPMANLKMLVGTQLGSLSRIPVKEHEPDLIASLPDSFDAREKWPNCQTVKEIDDTGCCSSNWIVAAVQTINDRTCIYSNGTVNVRLSVQDVLSCCLSCGYGCSGGYYGRPWEYWIDEGIVSGGQYGSSEGCMPYDFPPLVPGRHCQYYGYTKTCRTKCEDGYNVTYDKDKHRGKTVYLVRGEDHIRAEMFTNGPVEVLFLVYGDFFSYKHGVYSHKRGYWNGVHTVKMLGWGVEKGKKYWLVANNWGNLWGDKGYFKILRGKDECLIESYVLGGEPA